MRRCCQNYYFNKVLIANRGEIACRVIKTCNKLKIPTVAIFSTADAKSKHVRLADEAYCVGPPRSADSYLRMDKIIEICKQTGADAVHPGYGFLSENSDFSKLLDDNGITFVGPSERAIQAMGDKIESKKLAQSLGVNVIPGIDGEIKTEKELLDAAKTLGYPIMMKASAGGGGKGMRIATCDEDAISGFQLCKTESLASFGDDRMLVEKFIEQPRHIEIQVLGDKLGNVIYLPERECSIQRRNQKVIEEAPSTFLDDAVRRAMGEQSVMLAKGVDYHTAGTVEMMVDANRNFYFLEMNTRLQVEHPITEMITGVDLVEEMLRAAAGLPLSVAQSEIKINGWATESRVYSEDPLNNFLPVIGRLSKYEEPLDVEGVRCDSGIVEGSEISVHYDPLISKLCTWGPTRKESLERMAEALDGYVIRGLARTNINFLRDLMTHPKYVSGDITTKFIEEEFPNGYLGHNLSESECWELMSVAAVAHTLKDLTQYGISPPHPSQSPSSLSKRWVVSHGDFTAAVEIKASAAQPYLSTNTHLPNSVFSEFSIQIIPLPVTESSESTPPLHADLLDFLSKSNAGQTSALHHHSQSKDPSAPGGLFYTLNVKWELNDPVIRYTLEDCNGTKIQRSVQIMASAAFHYDLQFMGSLYSMSVLTPMEHALSEHMLPPPEVDLSRELRSPMPGVVVDCLVSAGDKVKAGQPVIILEAMKMQNVLHASSDGIVKEVLIPVGENVDDGATLILWE